MFLYTVNVNHCLMCFSFLPVCLVLSLSLSLFFFFLCVSFKEEDVIILMKSSLFIYLLTIHDFFFKCIYFILFIFGCVWFCCCVQAFSSCSEQRLLFVTVCRLLIVVASLVVEHKL